MPTLNGAANRKRQANEYTSTEMPGMHRLHQDSKECIAMLDDPARGAYQKPHEVITEQGD